MKVIIYTDGGADPNPGVGGWAAILQAGGKEKILTGSEPYTTNNRMELQAAIAALQALNRPSQVDFHTDSEYLRLGITEWIESWQASGWRRKGKEIANIDLWQKLDELVQVHDIEWHWVKGHGNDPLNLRADALARKARLQSTYDASPTGHPVQIFVKGTCKGNPGPGTWAALIEWDGETEQLSGASDRTTNNRMELMAAINGLQNVPVDEPVQIVTASDYLFQGATRWIHGWKKRDWRKRDGKQISNLDLWREIDDLQKGREVSWLSAKAFGSEPPQGLAEVSRIASDARNLV